MACVLSLSHANKGTAYVMLVANEHPLLQGTHVIAQEHEPMALHADLTHVNVARRHVLVTAFESRVLCSVGTD